MNLKELTALFRKLGARDPASWARAQHEERTDQVARYVFLREAWKRVVPPDDTSWIEGTIASTKPRLSDPGAGAGPALERLLAVGANRDDIHEVVRVMQYELLFSLCYLMENPGPLEPELADLVWQLVRTDENGETIAPINGLHESLLETDPSGREMRARRR